MSTITASDLLSRINAGTSCDVIDVRTPVEYRTVHATCARLIPLDQLNPTAVLNERPDDRRNQPLYLLCKSGQRAGKAAQKFKDAGFDNAVVVEGGTDAWAAAGCPVERGQAVMSLERQVRIAAGSIVLIGVILTLTVSIWFALLSGFVGAGLVFAGITDFCGMGLLLAKAPWNQCNTTTCCGN